MPKPPTRQTPTPRKLTPWEEGFTAGVISSLCVIQGHREEGIFDDVAHSCVSFDEVIASAKRDGNYTESNGLPQAVKRDAERRRWHRDHQRWLKRRALNASGSKGKP